MHRPHPSILSFFTWAHGVIAAGGALGLSLLIGPGAALGADAAAGKLVCVVLAKEGKVEVARKGQAQWAVAQTNQVLQMGDRLRTGLRSRATLRWSDLSVVRVNELTSLEIQPPEKAGDKPQLDLKSGATYFFSREKPTEVQFRTPVASGAIRGTEFNLAVDDNGRTVLSLIDGEVDLANAQGRETIRSGQQGSVEQGKGPTRTALIDAINVIQWALYYPAVVDPDELGLADPEKQAFGDSLKAYRSGDVLGALNSIPENRPPGSDAERLLQASLLLAAGRVDQTEASLKAMPAQSPAAQALRELIAAVKNQKLDTLSQPTTASEWMARSYYQQSHSRLQQALNAAREATRKSPGFGAAWVRVAELEFGFGRTPEALAALNKGLELSPRHAEGLALQGFLLAAQNKSADALGSFDRAIAADGALGNAWLGRGLVKIRMGHGEEGRADLQVAATLEPQRAVLRSYLGKAFTHTRDAARAEKELALAKKLDPEDPTSWLYSALLNQEENRINEAVEDLQRSQELNYNRSLFRSRLLLDQDQAVRGANLAAIYRDAGLFDYSVQEASRAVNYDYANYSAHLFLANSYDALRDPKSINLRFETPAFSELLVADLLAPAGGASLSQNISQQEYSRFFDAPHVGVYSGTEYFSSGDWVQSGSQYGTFQNFSYSLDAFYRTEQGQRPNNKLEQLALAARFKQQITAKDSVFAQVDYFDQTSGDVNQYYLQSKASPGLRVSEKQEPNLLLGYHREWSPGNHTLFLASRFDDTLKLGDPSIGQLFLEDVASPTILAFPGGPVVFSGRTNTTLRNPDDRISLGYRSDLAAYSFEVQQIYQTPSHTFILGGRYQTAWADTFSGLTRFNGTNGVEQQFNQPSDNNLNRLSFYAYDQWQLSDAWRLMAGLTYDRLHYPLNIDTAPIIRGEATREQFSPKIGLQWSPWEQTHLRAAYTRSLGGVFFDQSVRLEPTQVGGFNQSFRSLVPESVVGLVPGTRFETFGVGWDQSFKKTGTYLVVDGQILKSDGVKTVGILTNSIVSAPVISLNPPADSASSTRQALDYEEKSLVIALSQLLGREYSVGARYRLTHADLDRPFVDLPAGTLGTAGFDPNVSATLHQLYLYANYHHPCGFFGQLNTVWSQQSNHGYSDPTPGDDFWQYNIHLGYRFYRRRAEAAVGVLNLTDRDYRLNPLTLYNELPRERTFVASLKFYF